MHTARQARILWSATFKTLETPTADAAVSKGQRAQDMFIETNRGVSGHTNGPPYWQTWFAMNREIANSDLKGKYTQDHALIQAHVQQIQRPGQLAQIVLYCHVRKQTMDESKSILTFLLAPDHAEFFKAFIKIMETVGGATIFLSGTMPPTPLERKVQAHLLELGANSQTSRRKS